MEMIGIIIQFGQADITEPKYPLSLLSRETTSMDQVKYNVCKKVCGWCSFSLSLEEVGR